MNNRFHTRPFCLIFLSLVLPRCRTFNHSKAFSICNFFCANWFNFFYVCKLLESSILGRGNKTRENIFMLWVLIDTDPYTGSPLTKFSKIVDQSLIEHFEA